MTRDRWIALIRDRLIFVKIAVVILWMSWLIMMASTGFRRDIEGKPIGTDHMAFFTAARFIDEGRGTSIYDNKAVGDYQTALTGSEGWLLDAYRNPPFYALAYIPSARLPYLASFWIWSVIGLLLLWFGIKWLGSEKPVSAFVLAFSFYPVFSVLSFGQNSLLSFGFFALTYHAMSRNRFILAGMASGLLLFKPQLLMGLGLWWLLSIRTYWKCFVGLGITGVLLAAISFLMVPEETRVFIEKLPEIGRYSAFMFWNLHNPRGFGTLIAWDDKYVGNIVGFVCLGLGALCFGWFWLRHRGNRPVMFAAAVYFTLWASPHTMIYEWSIAVIPAVLLWENVKDKREDWFLVFSVCWVALFISTPIAKGLFELTWDGKKGWAIQISVPVLAVVAVWTERVLRTSEPGSTMEHGARM